MIARATLAPLLGAVLVGGASRRFGSPKALALYEGVPMAERVVRVLRSVVSEVVLVGSGPVPESLVELSRLEDMPGVVGPLAGILAALRKRPGRAWLVAACDQALVSQAACHWLVNERRVERVAVLPRRSAEIIEPLLAVYEPAALLFLEKLESAGFSSLQSLATEPGVATPWIPNLLQQAWISFDRPEDLAFEIAAPRSTSP